MKSRGRMGVIVGVLFVGVAIGIALGFMFDNDPQKSPQVRPPSTTGPGPTDEQNGAPVGYSRKEEGALAAARGFALLTTTDVIRDRDAYVEAMQTLAAPDWLTDAKKQAVNGYKFLVERYGTDVDVSGAVLRYDIMDFSPAKAEVKLWLVSIAAGSLRRTVDEVWGTANVKLVWIDGDWRVSGAENETGPAPVDLRSASSHDSAASLMKELDEFVDFEP